MKKLYLHIFLLLMGISFPHILTAADAPPSGLHVIQTIDQSITLQWDKAAGAVSDAIYSFKH